MARQGGELLRTGVRGLGQTLMTLGVVLLLFCFYELKVTNLLTDREQEQLAAELDQAWSTSRPVASSPDPPAAPIAGQGFAVLRIPRFGADYQKVVVEGVGVEDLKKGPGHIPGTAAPGEIGNVVLSGHRTTYGAPFSRMDELRPGDAVVLETQDRWFTYRITGTEIVEPTAVEVTFPVPGVPGATPTEALLTLTTCHPRYSARQRMIVSGKLQLASPKTDRPVALDEPVLGSPP